VRGGLANGDVTGLDGLDRGDASGGLIRTGLAPPNGDLVGLDRLDRGDVIGEPARAELGPNDELVKSDGATLEDRSPSGGAASRASGLGPLSFVAGGDSTRSFLGSSIALPQ
jgi:hypothetical protein